jgi:hypothetical protein
MPPRPASTQPANSARVALAELELVDHGRASQRRSAPRVGEHEPEGHGAVAWGGLSLAHSTSDLTAGDYDSVSFDVRAPTASSLLLAIETLAGKGSYRALCNAGVAPDRGCRAR